LQRVSVVSSSRTLLSQCGYEGARRQYETRAARSFERARVPTRVVVSQEA